MDRCEASPPETVLPYGVDDLPPPPRTSISFRQADGAIPDKIGRYDINGVLGSGSFGIVYQGYDVALDRQVAVKVPRRQAEQDLESYVDEARRLASLDHPAIVPVYDVGFTPDGLCYVVSKLIEGQDLQQLVSTSPLSFSEATQFVTRIADALHYAHSLGLVHRDVKPANILLDRNQNPYLADFGLALQEDDLPATLSIVGTPAYMSPEQSRGEGHLIDRRTDIFSLGAVYYELLTGRLPFEGDSSAEILVGIQSAEITPPTTLRPTVPRELERICLKCLARRATDRYSSAQQLQDELKVFLNEVADSISPSTEEAPPPCVIPNGLQCFDEHDADFFLRLLPGPRDRNGLPEQIRFWQRHVESLNAENTFRVGVIYGPSGSGKSSLVRAGLVPHLAEHVTTVLVEATAAGTADNLRSAICTRFPDLTGEDAASCLRALRRNMASLPGRKVLIVIDQFEQWLHFASLDGDDALVRALRQCDGRRIQCVVVVRDDYWVPISRFMQQLDLPFSEDENAAAVEAFDRRHATQVLIEFGRAANCLASDSAQISKSELAFLDQAVSELAPEGRAHPVHLVTFFEIMKHRPWTTASLRRLGGTVGIGVRFLDDLVSSPTAPREYSHHENAIRNVLSALLPPAGQSIRGKPRGAADLREVSGYDRSPENFQQVLDILVRKSRLLTTCTRGRVEPELPIDADQIHYQLTHDFLIPSLRQWLAAHKLESRRGRAELRLEERAALWDSHREKKQLPTLIEWLQIEIHTRHSRWAEAQMNMMRRARRHHCLRTVAVVAVLLAAVLLVREGVARQQTERIVQRLMASENDEIWEHADRLKGYRRWAPQYVAPHLDKAADDSREKILASVAMYVCGGQGSDFLMQRMMTSKPDLFVVLKESLASEADEVTQLARQLVDRGPKHLEVMGDSWTMSGAKVRFNAMACLPSEDPRWADHSQLVATHFVEQLQQSPEQFESLQMMFQGVRRPLFDALADNLPDATPDELRLMLSIFRLDSSLARDRVARRMQRHEALGEDMGSDITSRKRGIRRANFCIVLLALGDPASFRQGLAANGDLTVRSYLVTRTSSVNLDPAVFVQWMKEEKDVTVCRAILLTLGGFPRESLGGEGLARLFDSITPHWREELSAPEDASADPQSLVLTPTAVKSLLDSLDDPGQRSACEWMLRRWGFEGQLRAAVAFQAGSLQRPDRQWYVSRHDHVMRVFDRARFQMGSPVEEPMHDRWESQHQREINRTFSVSVHEVTNRQFQRFAKAVHGKRRCDSRLVNNHPDCPVALVSWSDAAAYCNWLSAESGLDRSQWCYTETETSTPGQLDNSGECYDPEQAPHVVMKPVEDFLSRDGFRLPTESEWEYACRATTNTPWSFGSTGNLLPVHAWCASNSGPDLRARSVGLKIPNDFGMFDMYGNVREWCHDFFDVSYGLRTSASSADWHEDKGGPSDGEHRVLRGLAAGDPILARSAYREASPDHRGVAIGFRIARTIKGESP